MKLQPDVLVCGGGCAGLCAALAAARQGASTLLVERAGFAGGIITAVGLPYFDGIADPKTKRLLTPGIPLELLAKSGVCAADATTFATHNPTLRNVERFKLLADQLLKSESPRLTVLFHSFAAGVKLNGSRIDAVIVANKDGLVEVSPRTAVIDATGDADVAFFAGAPVTKTPPLQPMTMHFRIGNVNAKAAPKLRELIKAQCVAAQEAGEIPAFYGPGVMFMFAANEAYFHAIRVPGDGSDAADLTRAEMQGRSDAWAMFERFKKNVPGFEESYFVACGPCIGIRETRRIDGRYVLSEEDITQNRRFDDAVATGCWYLDRHPNTTTVGTANAGEKVQPQPYDIPYRTLLPRNVDNLLVAGRCHSATPAASSSTRVTATAMALGQAAGYAAALAARNGTELADHDGIVVREEMEAHAAGPVHL
jgi:hypothetical protein